jgi:DNA-binding MarR family transcriptional regulator
MVPPKAADGFVEPQLDVSWIRVYLLISATSHRISSADVVADLTRLGFKYSPRSIARIMKGLDTKGYVARTAPRSRSRRILFRTTAKGRTVRKAVRRQLRELLERTSNGEFSPGSAEC